MVNCNVLPKSIDFGTYFEPFLGSGAIFFSLKPKKAYLSDTNNDLIELYQVIREQPEQFTQSLLIHQNNHSKEYYYQIRDSSPKTRLQKAARLLYLNRTCWNGLYRVNLKGRFNVPIGTKSSVILETDDFISTSKLLRRAEIVCKDFEEVINITKHGDLLFVDPPYTVQHNTNNFIKYNEKIFSWGDQIRLKETLLKAKARGVQIIVTNADNPSIIELYSDIGKYYQLKRHSVLSGNPSKRGPTTEALFLANIKADCKNLKSCIVDQPRYSSDKR